MLQIKRLYKQEQYCFTLNSRIILIKLKNIVIKSLSKCESDLNYKLIHKSYDD